jgi:hypothetical protein
MSALNKSEVLVLEPQSRRYVGFLTCTVKYKSGGQELEYEIGSAPNRVVMYDGGDICAVWNIDSNGNGVNLEFYAGRTYDPRDIGFRPTTSLIGALKGYVDSSDGNKIFGFRNDKNFMECVRFRFSGKDAEAGTFTGEGSFKIEEYIELPPVTPLRPEKLL